MTNRGAKSYASVWDAIADSPEEAANLRLRSELMDKIKGHVLRNSSAVRRYHR